MKFFAVLTSALALSGVAEAQEVKPLDIDVETVSRYTGGGCEVKFILSNFYTDTMKVSANAFIVDKDKMTLGESLVSFSPALPDGKSVGIAHFYPHRLANGDCPAAFMLKITPQYCFLSENRKLKDAYCQRTISFEVG